MRILKSKKCNDCENDYVPTGSNQPRCPECMIIHRRESGRIRMQEFRRTKGVKVGSGKGGNNASGEEDSQYSSGRSYFHKIRFQIKLDVRYCQNCDKDLLNATRYFWCVHHIDHNPRNNSRENLKLLCKRCHQIEHNCSDAFKCVKTKVSQPVGD